ncbi:MAG: CocE/NonD family hydrolase [Promethearchaeota archaeon]|jgi:putative CocE/NonD family hydrolase
MTQKMEIDYNPFHQTWKFPQRKTFEEGYFTSNVYIPMRDGVKIAATICLPKGLTSEDKLPTLLYQTRYWRAEKLRIPFRWVLTEVYAHTPTPELFTKRGYAIVYVDVRGCGASFGSRPYPFSEEEIKDGGDIINWIINQPWSDGNVVSNGISYTGTAAELLAVNNHSAVRAVMPGHGFWDPYTDVSFPGGCYDSSFTEMWSFGGKALDNNNTKAFKPLNPIGWLLSKGVQPIDSDTNQSQLKQAMEAHSSNEYVFNFSKDIDFRDELTIKGSQILDLSIFNYQKEIEKSNLPIISWCSWLDSGYGTAMIHRFINLKNPHIAIIGDWNHGAAFPGNPLKPDKTEVSPTPKERITTWIDIFESILFGEGFQEKTLYYYTMGEEKWKMTHVWPPQGQIRQKWFLEEEFGLSTSKPKVKLGEDSYRINFRASTGRLNRWWTLLGLPLDYSNREKADSKLLTYTSSPLQEDIEITGQPIITLYLASTHEDGAIYAYLEEVDTDGNIHYITDGNLRLIHRKVSLEKPPYKILVPYHSFKKADAAPLVPGEITEVKFEFRVTSVVIRKGHRIKLAIAGADRDTFKRYPSEGKPTITIARNTHNASYIDLPIIQKEE